MEENQIEEAITAVRESLKYTAKDDEILSFINKSIASSKTVKDKMDAIGKRNKTYWRDGTDLDMNKIHPKKSKVVNNKIFMAVETLIALSTGETPKPEVSKRINNNTREKIVKALEIVWEVQQKMKFTLQKVLRSWFWNRVGVLKYNWQEGFTSYNVNPSKIGFDERATSLKDCEFIYESLEDTIENLIDKYPNAKKYFKDKTQYKSKVKYIEFWGGNGEWVAWKYLDVLLDKQKNPNYDWKNKDNNLCKAPKFPYIFLNVFQDESLYDETSLIEQAIPIQEAINKAERQILDLNDGQKTKVVVSAESMSETKAQKYVNETGDLLIYLDKKAPPQGFQIVQSGKPDASLFNTLTHLINEIDNIFGTHSTTRGERAESETLGGRQLLMQADLGRLGPITDAIEQFSEDWYNAFLQLNKVFGEDEIKMENSETRVSLLKEDIKEQVMVKKGSNLPVDKASRSDMAIELAKFDRIDPETLFEELGYGNADKRTERLYDYLVRTGKAQPEAPKTPEQQQLDQLKKIMDSPEFDELPNEEKQQFVEQAKEITQRINQNLRMQQMQQVPQQINQPAV